MGDIYLEYKILDLKIPEGLDPTKLNTIYNEHLAAKKLDVMPIAKSFDELEHNQAEHREKIKKSLLTIHKKKIY